MANRRDAVILAVFVILITLFGMFRPCDTFDVILTQKGDDWLSFAKGALAINSHTEAKTPFFGPGGIVYYHFIASCIKIFGESSRAIFVIQHFLLGMAVVLVYFAFADKVRRRTVFLTALIVIAVLDMSKYYTIKFLSENLAVFTVPLYFFLLSRRLYVLSGIALGLSVLTRPCILPYGLLMCFIGIPFAIAALGTMSLLAVRNMMVCGKPVLIPGVIRPAFFSNGCGNIPYKILFCFGFLPLYNKAYRIRPHWMVMWALYFVYIIRKVRRGFEPWEIPVHLFIWMYMATILTTDVDNYGFRLILPVLFFVVVFAVKSCEAVNEKRS